jgi:hypothetical protein
MNTYYPECVRAMKHASTSDPTFQCPGIVIPFLSVRGIYDLCAEANHSLAVRLDGLDAVRH